MMSFSLRADPLRAKRDLQTWENRAQSHTPAAGGYTVPQDFQRELEVALLSFGGMREAARVVRTTSGADLPWPTSNDTSNEGEILGENAEANEQDIVFGSRTLKAHKYSSKLIRVPVELLQDSAINLPSEIGSRLGERIGRVTNRHFTTGAGTTEPEGIVTGATLGVTAASATAITYDELVNLEHSVNAAYRKNATFMFSDATLAAIKKLKDSDGRPLWMAGLTEKEPDRILGYKYVINDDVADMASTAKSIVFGDFQKYMIRDVQDVVLLRLDERFAEFGQVAFLAFSRHDGALLDAGTRPVKFLQQAA
jgi:HK97 family phage major capsid protein